VEGFSSKEAGGESEGMPRGGTLVKHPLQGAWLWGKGGVARAAGEKKGESVKFYPQKNKGEGGGKKRKNARPRNPPPVPRNSPACEKGEVKRRRGKEHGKSANNIREPVLRREKKKKRAAERAEGVRLAQNSCLSGAKGDSLAPRKRKKKKRKPLDKAGKGNWGPGKKNTPILPGLSSALGARGKRGERREKGEGRPLGWEGKDRPSKWLHCEKEKVGGGTEAQDRRTSHVPGG